ncbi:FABP family protein [Glutamicibacter soli]|uniref:FABP family protein n=1 Tax=Glutamicibacter soli TaxID=453836 RepID=UPI003C73BAEE
MTLHPGLSAVAGLIGTWRGEGAGEYPTIDPFAYTEEVTFSDVGKPFLHYMQRTWSPAGAPMHTETGYLRLVDGSSVEFVLAQPTGQAELAEGPLAATADGFTCELASRVSNSASAKQVDGTERRIALAGDVLTTHFAMAAVGVPMTHHLKSVMHRV